MSEPSSNSAGWKRLFEELPIKKGVQASGVFRLTANQIKKIAEREPRLMTKFDSRKQRPKLLSDLGITILPVTNGEYLLLKGDGYFDLSTSNRIEVHDATRIRKLETVPWRTGIRTEGQAIDALYIASALRSFADDDSLQLTIRGRLRSNKFSFNFNTDRGKHKVTVDGVQIEVDSGFEGKGVLLVEAKFGSIDSFIVRQLYYPYRNLLSQGITKKITPILLVYSNKVYSLFEFAFTDPDSYHSARLQRHVNYSLEGPKALPRFADVIPRCKRRPPELIPFPQADDLSKVVDLTEILTEGPASKKEIAERFGVEGVDPRQGDYYANAAAWLGLAERANHQYALTAEGKTFAEMDRADRLDWLTRRVREMPVFSEAANAFLDGNPLSIEQISKLVARMPNLSGTTPARRASTVRAWIEWLARELGG